MGCACRLATARDRLELLGARRPERFGRRDTRTAQFRTHCTVQFSSEQYCTGRESAVQYSVYAEACAHFRLEFAAAALFSTDPTPNRPFGRPAAPLAPERHWTSCAVLYCSCSTRTRARRNAAPTSARKSTRRRCVAVRCVRVALHSSSSVQARALSVADLLLCLRSSSPTERRQQLNREAVHSVRQSIRVESSGLVFGLFSSGLRTLLESIQRELFALQSSFS